MRAEQGHQNTGFLPKVPSMGRALFHVAGEGPPSPAPSPQRWCPPANREDARGGGGLCGAGLGLESLIGPTFD